MRELWRRSIGLWVSFGIALTAGPALAQEVPGSWRSAKNTTADEVYFDVDRTFYCGCTYQSDNDSDGSGTVTLADCEMAPLEKNQKSATRIEWEHVVPASLMPARQMSCWEKPHQFKRCKNKAGTKVTKKRRDCCEAAVPPARKMILDLHNLTPSIGQVNQYRKNGRYGVVEGGESWPGCTVEDTGGLADGPEHLFEPADCTKGDVARIWFYMHDRHGVVIPDAEWDMFVDWAEADPVSPWEAERDRRIGLVQGNNNPYVAGWIPDPTGACNWEPVLPVQ